GGVATLDPAKVNGKIVVCDRGTIGFANKAQAVKDAGGIAVVFVNVPSGSTEIGPPPSTVVPALKVLVASRDAIRAYAGPSNASATMSINVVFNTPAPYTASFSSRGPSNAAQGNILKPDIMAPGVDVIAAVAPTIDNAGESFASYQGTSMATPHIAGIAALFKQVYPKWSPMMIKSAMMTTAYDVLDGPSTNPLVVFRQGAGFVNPTAALDPGLVFDSSYTDWAGFMCGQYIVPSSYCTSQRIPVIDPVNMNEASIAVGTLAGSQTVTRRVTNVSTRPTTYTASLSGLDGYTVKVSPPKLAVPAGQTKTFTVTITANGGGVVTVNPYSAGQLTWSDGKHNVRMPIVVNPVMFAAPPEVNGTAYNVKFGYTGPFSVALQGPVSGAKQSTTIATNDVKWFTVTVPEGSPFVRFETFAEEFPVGADVDMYVFDPSNHQVGSSTGPTAGESVSVPNPAPGTWSVAIIGYNIPTKTPAPLNLYSWVVPNGQSSFATVKAPTSAKTGTQGSVTVTLTGRAAAGKYIGFATYGGASGVGGSTAIKFTK
ncbi:MAG TPA: S8 family serine peptidase, partial [Ramlibacter sp.]